MHRSSCLCCSPRCCMRMRVRPKISARMTPTRRARALRSTIGGTCDWGIDPLIPAWYAGGESRVQVPNERWKGYRRRVWCSRT